MRRTKAKKEANRVRQARWHKKRMKDPAYRKIVNEYHNANVKWWRAQVKEQLLDVYGRKCVCCGEDSTALLTLEHINGGGGEHRRNGRNGRCKFASYPIRAWRDAIKEKNPKKYEILCFNCNYGRAMYGVCPHVRPPEKPQKPPLGHITYWRTLDKR